MIILEEFLLIYLTLKGSDCSNEREHKTKLGIGVRSSDYSTSNIDSSLLPSDWSHFELSWSMCS